MIGIVWDSKFNDFITRWFHFITIKLKGLKERHGSWKPIELLIQISFLDRLSQDGWCLLNTVQEANVICFIRFFFFSPKQYHHYLSSSGDEYHRVGCLILDKFCSFSTWRNFNQNISRTKNPNHMKQKLALRRDSRQHSTNFRLVYLTGSGRKKS